MKRKGLRIALWVLLTPLTLFVILMILLYVPPVQSFIRKQATAIASDATGMDISVERIDLRFPLNLLVRGVLVVQPDSTGLQQPDTLLNLGSLNVRLQALPLFKGQIEIDDISLEQMAVNSAGLIEGMQVSGTLGRFSLESHGVDLTREDVVLNAIQLSDTQIQVLLADTTETEPEDTTETELNWKIALRKLKLENVSVDLQMPLDSMCMAARIGDAEINDATVDLGKELYGWRTFLLTNSSVDYDSTAAADALVADTTKTLPADSLSTDSVVVQHSPGFNASHIALRDIRIGIDSVLYYGRNINAVIREFSLYERSGLSITSLTGQVFADSTLIRVPLLKLQTPHSEMNFKANTYWELVNIPTTGHLDVYFDAHIGKQDVLLFAGDLPESFVDAYPFRPLTIRAGTEGNLKEMQISRFNVDLPGAFSISGGGEMHNLTDSLRRNINMDFEMHTQDLNFLTALGGSAPDGSLIIPDSMNLAAHIGMEGSQCTAKLDLDEAGGVLAMNADYNLSTEAYHANLDVNALQVNHFLPQDSIYTLTLNVAAEGQGTDFESPKTAASAVASLKELQYGNLNVADVDLHAGLKSSVATVKLASNNTLLKMQADADLRLDRTYLDGTLNIDVQDVNFYELGAAPQPLKKPFALTIDAEARHDSVKLKLNAGDMDFRFRARSTLKTMMEKGDAFMEALTQQIEDRKLDHAALRRLLPSAGMHMKAGTENPVSYFLAAQGIHYDDFKLSFGFTPEIGINGRTAIHGFHTDSLQLDTIFFAIRQDTARMTLQGGVINGPQNPQFVFHSTLTGEIRNEDAELTIDYKDKDGNTGVLFGINAVPLKEGHGRGNGLLLKLMPEEPVIAYRNFRFAERHNWIYLHKNMRVYANIDMESDEGLGFKMQSDPRDTISLQNINVELTRFRLEDLSESIPYMPQLTGLLSAEANYIQTPTSLQVAAAANVDELTYEHQSVGNVGLGGTWLPGEKDANYISAYFTYDDKEVMTVDGMLTQRTDGKDTLDITASLDRLPLKMANAFIPDRMAELTGTANGNLSISGPMEQPNMVGDFALLDSANVFVRQMGARYWFDNRPVKIEDNKLTLEKFSIYTTSNNPFTIDGNVDFSNMDSPTADIRLRAQNYTLLEANYTRESLVYGKVFVDLNAMIRGPLDDLNMRGTMNLLGNTNVTYVLTNSPLTVEDRLDGLVTFVSFNDTTSTATIDAPMLSLGGLDMNMTIHIDEAVRLRADLSVDRTKYIELEGGGDLNLQYTAQGDMSLTGRYTLTGGSMKYSLPIIPLKEFEFNSGSYVDWRGDIMNPALDLKATERVRASVSDGDDGASRTVNFDVSIAIKNNLESPDLIFDISSPEDATVENELQSMGADERSKQAIAMLATGIYLGSGSSGGLTMGAALNSVIQNQINSLAGGLKNASISVGVEDRTSAETGDTQKDFSFRYSQRFFNDRVQIVIGGKVSTGANATNDVESFIDNISLEYRLDTSGTRYIRAFHNKNYESVLDGEITETGVGLVLRKKLDRVSDLFIFRRKKSPQEQKM